MYVYQAQRRNKDPENSVEVDCPKIIREVRYSHQTEEMILEKLKHTVSQWPGLWRFYRSVNRRDQVKAKLELIETMTKQLVLPDSVSNKNPESLWKTLLMQPRNKAERRFLIDVDADFDTARIAMQTVLDNHAGPFISPEMYTTPNGYHIIVDPFDPRILKDFENVEVKKDALVLLQTMVVDEA